MPQLAGKSALYEKVGPGLSSYNRYDMKIGDYADQWLREKAHQPKDQPWMLYVGFVAPHMPLVVPQKYLDLYLNQEIKLPKLLPKDGYLRHPWVERMANFWDHDLTLGNDERRRLAIACYFGLISFLDDQIGRLMQTLESTGLNKTTRVIYSSDHGDNLGTRGLWNKDVLYRESTGIPLIMAGPDIPKRVCSTNVSLVDLFPTFLEGTGVSPSKEDLSLPGKSLFQLAQMPDDSTRIGFSEYHAVGAETGAFMLTQGKYKFHYYVGFQPELFDLELDPEETHDLAELPQHQSTVKYFETLLRQLLDPEAVDRQAKKDQATLVNRFGGREAALKLGYPGETPTDQKFN
jgi:choline-sulfatase